MPFHVRVFFGGKTKRPCFDLFIHWLMKQIRNTYRNHFSRSYENRSITPREFNSLSEVPLNKVQKHVKLPKELSTSIGLVKYIQIWRVLILLQWSLSTSPLRTSSLRPCSSGIVCDVGHAACEEFYRSLVPFCPSVIRILILVVYPSIHVQLNTAH